MVTGVLSKCCNYPCLVWKNTLQQGIKLNTTWTTSSGAFSPLKVYRGLPMACMNLGGTNAVQFVGTGFFQKLLAKTSSDKDAVQVGGAFLGEMMGTMLLVLVVLETAVNSGAVTTQEQGKQNLAPIAIGLAVFMAHVMLIPITGCSINPTRSFGPAILSGKPSNSWLFWVAPLCGSTLGSLLWFVVQMFDPNKVAAAPDDKDDDDDDEEERDEDDA